LMPSPAHACKTHAHDGRGEVVEPPDSVIVLRRGPLGKSNKLEL
jgi:hypothetical protein